MSGRRRARRILRGTLLGLAVTVLLVYLLFPLYYALVTSFTPAGGVFDVGWWPRSFDFGNYVQVFADQPFGRNIVNSVVVATASVALALALGTTAAYALGRMHFRGRGLLLATILGVSMFPQIAVLTGMFELIRALGLYDGLAGLVLSYTLLTLPFTVWVLTSFMRSLPREVEEAAILDGAGPWTMITRVFAPMLWPAMVSTGLLAFIVAWNEFLFALTFTLGDTRRTVPVAIALITGGSEHELPWGKLMAASVIVTLPLVALVLAFQRRMVSGLTAGAVKG